MNNRPDVPKEFLSRFYGPESRPESKKRFEEGLKEKRAKMAKLSKFNNLPDATKEAVKIYQEEDYECPSVWQEPRDVGREYVAVRIEDRENAYFSGYKEIVNETRIARIAQGRPYEDVEEIEEI